jgi:hypothetical protein
MDEHDDVLYSAEDAIEQVDLVTWVIIVCSFLIGCYAFAKGFSNFVEVLRTTH